MRLDVVKVSLLAHIATEPQTVLAGRKPAKLRRPVAKQAAGAALAAGSASADGSQASVEGSQASAEMAVTAVVEKSHAQVMIEVPVLVNHKELLKGDTLYMHKKPKTRDERGRKATAVENKRLLAKHFEDSAKRLKGVSAR